MPAGPENLYETQRRDSFKHWPFPESDPCSISKMSEAGFYWCGSAAEPDSAACFVCGKVLDNWEPADDPWLEHRKHAPQCLFASMGRPEAQLTVDEFLRVLQKIAVDRVDRLKTVDHQQTRMRQERGTDAIQKYFLHK